MVRGTETRRRAHTSASVTATRNVRNTRDAHRDAGAQLVAVGAPVANSSAVRARAQSHHGRDAVQASSRPRNVRLATVVSAPSDEPYVLVIQQDRHHDGIGCVAAHPRDLSHPGECELAPSVPAGAGWEFRQPIMERVAGCAAVKFSPRATSSPLPCSSSLPGALRRAATGRRSCRSGSKRRQSGRCRGRRSRGLRSRGFDRSCRRPSSRRLSP
jgi:hypothetical protein